MTEINTLLMQRPMVGASPSGGYSRKKINFHDIHTQAADSVSSITVDTPGSYTAIPTASLTGGDGTGATAGAVHMKSLTATPVTPQSGSGSYAPSNTITVDAGTGTDPVITVTHTQVVSATVAAAGTGGTPGTQTVTGTTGTGTKFQASVTVSGGGAITAVLSITVAGDYTANPSSLTAEPVTGASLTGAQLSVKMGVLTATVSTPGDLTVLNSSPLAQSATSGTGTGFTCSMTYGVLSVPVTDGGQDYTEVPDVEFSSGSATATAVIAGTNDPITVSLEFTSALSTADYCLNVTPSQAALPSYANKTVNGVDITLTPLTGGTLIAGTMNVALTYVD